MEEQWYADRCRLREAQHAHPDWSKRRLADELGRSLGWVKKWRRRLRGQPRARQHPPPPLDPVVVERILAIRDAPPANLQRVPGPKAILYYLPQDVTLAERGARLPRSTRTVWRILRRHGRIARRTPHGHEPVDRPPPLTCWQLDWCSYRTWWIIPWGPGRRALAWFRTSPIQRDGGRSWRKGGVLEAGGRFRRSSAAERTAGTDIRFPQQPRRI